jgi:hypothetical protein
MLCKRSAHVLIATCALGALCGATVFAADLTTATAARNGGTASGAYFSPRDKLASIKTGKSKRSEKEPRRKIVTYKLFHDPVFKLNGAIADKRYFAAIHGVNGFGAGSGDVPPGGLMSNPVDSGPVAALNAEESGLAGAGFGCREKSFSASPVRREMTACYGHKLDKAWKTHTYVSKEFSEGRQNWGGGLALGYAY